MYIMKFTRFSSNKMVLFKLDSDTATVVLVN